MRKLKFFLIGFLPGMFFLFFIFNKKGARCSGYLPNSRVIAETLSKDFAYTSHFQKQMNQAQVSETFLRDSIITNGEINFDKSHAQKQPCPDYLLRYPDKNPRFEISFEKCKDSVTFTGFKKLR